MAEPTGELRFGFGRNWAEFLHQNFSDSILEESQRHLAGFIRRAKINARLDRRGLPVRSVFSSPTPPRCSTSIATYRALFQRA